MPSWNVSVEGPTVAAANGHCSTDPGGHYWHGCCLCVNSGDHFKRSEMLWGNVQHYPDRCISHVHLREHRRERGGPLRKALEGDWMNPPSITFAVGYLDFFSAYVVTVWDFLLLWGATLNVCQRPVASHDALQYLTKLFKRPFRKSLRCRSALVFNRGIFSLLMKLLIL